MSDKPQPIELPAFVREELEWLAIEFATRPEISHRHFADLLTDKVGPEIAYILQRAFLQIEGYKGVTDVMGLGAHSSVMRESALVMRVFFTCADNATLGLFPIFCNMCPKVRELLYGVIRQYWLIKPNHAGCYYLDLNPFRIYGHGDQFTQFTPGDSLGQAISEIGWDREDKANQGRVISVTIAKMMGRGISTSADLMIEVIKPPEKPLAYSPSSDAHKLHRAGAILTATRIMEGSLPPNRRDFPDAGDTFVE